ncbi:hypothetical protein ABZP36_018802 [Zizania latifolia]
MKNVFFYVDSTHSTIVGSNFDEYSVYLNQCNLFSQFSRFLVKNEFPFSAVFHVGIRMLEATNVLLSPYMFDRPMDMSYLSSSLNIQILAIVTVELLHENFTTCLLYARNNSLQLLFLNAA